MTGLEKIISQIEYESDERCRITLEEANKKAEIIIKDAQTQAEQISNEKASQTAKKIENIMQSADSSAELAKSKILLKSKLEIIDEMLGKALDEIKSLGDDEYFEIVKELILGNAKEGEGVLRLSAKDVKRLPKGFIDSVNKELKGKKINLGDELDINGGFILVYGDIDINCSFDAIALSKRDELKDALNALLFN